VAARVLFALEALCYRSSVLVTGQTEGIVGDIKRRFPSQRVLLLTNGIDVADFASFDAPKEPGGEDFVVGYAGVLGHAQGLSAVVAAAGRLETRNARARLEFFGDGPLREQLEAEAQALGLTNLRFFGHRPRKEIVDRMKGWDAGLVPLVNVPLMAGALPSKMFEVMAASLPVLLFAPPGEASRLVETAGAGICAEPENAEAVADVIHRLSLDREAARRMGELGRRFVLEHFDRARIARTFMATLETVMVS
jgi:glycosyltransferase involved in cell wall biosynthesis